MVEWLDAVPAIVSGSIIVAGFVAVSLGIAFVVDRLSPRELRIEHNDLAGFILAVIGVIYAVLLAFVTIGVWERFEVAESRSYEEAAALTAIYRDAGSFEQGREVRAAVRTYVEGLLADEWPRMQRGEESQRVDGQIEHIDAMVRGLRVTSQSRQDVHDQMLAELSVALGDRDARLSEDATGINGVMWVVLALGAFVTIGFTSLFGFRRDVMQFVMIGALALLIGLVLFLAIALNYPYRGAVTIDPKAFHTALRTFDALGP
jgi:hypothetical protein